MDRRSLLLGAGAVGIAAAVGGTAYAAAEPGDAERHRREQPVLTWALTGGFVPAGWTALRAPRLVAYEDGTLIADATRRLRVGPGTLRSARNHAIAVLRDPDNARPRPGAPIIADAPATEFTVRGHGRRFRAQFEALVEGRESRTYPAPAYALLDHLTRLRDRTLAIGVPYRVDAVRLIAIRIDPQQPTGSEPAPWPAGVPVPHLGKDEFVAQLDLRGREARALIRAVPHPDPAQWPVFRTVDGQLLQVNWRYLLPHE